MALGEVGIGNTTVAATLAAVLDDLSADDVVGLRVGADTAMVRRKTEVVETAVARMRAGPGGDRLLPEQVLAAVG